MNIMKWKVEVEISIEKGYLSAEVVTKITNPDNSWGVIKNIVHSCGSVYLGLTSHSPDLNVPEIETLARSANTAMDRAVVEAFAAYEADRTAAIMN